VSVCLTAETELNATTFSSPDKEIFWSDDTSLGLPNVGARFLFSPLFPQNSPLNLGLSNCNAIHQGALPHTAEAYQVLTDSPGGATAEFEYDDALKIS